MKSDTILTVQCYTLVTAQNKHSPKQSQEFSHKVQIIYCSRYLAAFTKLHGFEDLDSYIYSSFPNSFSYL